MAQVTALVPKGKGRMEVNIDGEFAFVLYKGELARFQIREGSELEREELVQIFREILCPRACKRVLYLLQKKDYTRRQLQDKLREGGYPAEIAEQAISYAESYSYVDDSSYAERYVNCYAGRKSRGALRQALLQKGIARETVEQALAAYEEEQGESVEETERNMIRSLLQKRNFDSETADRKEKQKHFAFLMRKGFKADDISACLQESG